MFSVKKLSIILLLALLPSLSRGGLNGHQTACRRSRGRCHRVAAAQNQQRSQRRRILQSALPRLLRARAIGTKAFLHARRLCRFDPENAQYHLWLGRVYGEKADHSGFLTAAGLAKKVRSEFETAVRLNPDSAEARTDLAEFYMEAPGIVGGGRDKAEAQAQKIATMDPVRAGWVKGRLAEKNKDLVSAENQYRAAIAASHGAALAWLNLAYFYRHTGRLDSMEDAIRHASCSSDGSTRSADGVREHVASCQARSSARLPSCSAAICRPVRPSKLHPRSKRTTCWERRSSNRATSQQQLRNTARRLPWPRASPSLRPPWTA